MLMESEDDYNYNDDHEISSQLIHKSMINPANQSWKSIIMSDGLNIEMSNEMGNFLCPKIVEVPMNAETIEPVNAMTGMDCEILTDQWVNINQTLKFRCIDDGIDNG